MENEPIIIWAMKAQNEKRKIHERYICGVLVSIIVFLVSFNYGDNEKLTNYISFALTISSILLALIAIGITVLGNSNLDQRFGELKYINDTIQDSAKKLIDCAGDLEKKLPELAVNLAQVRERAEETNLLFRQAMSQPQPPGFAGVADVPASSTAGENAEADAPLGSTKQNLEEFLKICSWSGRIYLYTVAKRFEDGKKINPVSFQKYTSPRQTGYYLGFQVGCVSSGILISSKESVAPLPNWTSQNIYSYIQKEIVEREKKKTSDDDKKFSSYIKKILGKAEEFSSFTDEEMENIEEKKEEGAE